MGDPKTQDTIDTAIEDPKLEMEQQVHLWIDNHKSDIPFYPDKYFSQPGDDYTFWKISEAGLWGGYVRGSALEQQPDFSIDTEGKSFFFLLNTNSEEVVVMRINEPLRQVLNYLRDRELYISLPAVLKAFGIPVTTAAVSSLEQEILTTFGAMLEQHSSGILKLIAFDYPTSQGGDERRIRIIVTSVEKIDPGIAKNSRETASEAQLKRLRAQIVSLVQQRLDMGYPFIAGFELMEICGDVHYGHVLKQLNIDNADSFKLRRGNTHHVYVIKQKGKEAVTIEEGNTDKRYAAYLFMSQYPDTDELEFGVERQLRYYSNYKVRLVFARQEDGELIPLEISGFADPHFNIIQVEDTKTGEVYYHLASRNESEFLLDGTENPGGRAQSTLGTRLNKSSRIMTIPQEA